MEHALNQNLDRSQKMVDGQQFQDNKINNSLHMIQGPNGQQILVYAIPSVTTTGEDSVSVNNSKQSNSSADRMRKLREKRKNQDPAYTTSETKRIIELRKKKRAEASNTELKALREKQNNIRRAQRARVKQRITFRKRRVKIEEKD